MNKLISLPLISYVLRAAVRDKLVLSLLILMVVGTSVAIFIGSSAVIEADQFAMVFAAGGLRLAGVLGLTLFAVFFIAPRQPSVLYHFPFNGAFDTGAWCCRLRGNLPYGC
jgi:hypothetical protein